MLHGFPTSSIDWFDVAGLLAGDHRVGMLDFPGFGFSDKPRDGGYALQRDRQLVEHYAAEILGAGAGAVIAHDRGDSVALALAERCSSPDAGFELRHLVLSDGNMFLPLANLTGFQRLILDPASAPAVLEALTPEMLAAGMGQSTFTPARSPQDPEIVALADTFAHNDGVAVLHETIQYLVERSQNERGVARRARRLGGADDPGVGSLRHRLPPARGGPRVERLPRAEAGDERVLAAAQGQPLSPERPAAGVRGGDQELDVGERP